MSDTCYYNNDECGGALWYCRTCEEWFCENHGHVTSKGTNVEPKIVGFDFDADSFVSVQAPEGTDPDTLYEQAKELFKERINSGNFEVTFVEIFDED